MLASCIDIAHARFKGKLNLHVYKIIGKVKISSPCLHMNDRREFAVKCNMRHNESFTNTPIYCGLLVLRHKWVELTSGRIRGGNAACCRIYSFLETILNWSCYRCQEESLFLMQ